jgi:hypothetical protein
MPYAYVRDVWNESTLTPDTYGWAFALCFKTSPTFNLTDTSIAYYETYRAEISSGKGSIGNVSLHAQAISDTGASNNFTFYLDHSWYNFTSDDDSTGSTGFYNGTSTNFDHGFGRSWDLSSGAPENLTITIYRENWIIHTVNSTDIHIQNPEVIQQITLHRYGNGFLYNTAILQDELDKINPFFPELKLL